MDLSRIRQILIDIHQFGEEGLEFDTEKANQLEYTAEEIQFVERILEMEAYDPLHELLRSQVLFCYSESCIAPAVFYLPIPKIIFLVNQVSNISSYIFEEELEKDVADTKHLLTMLAWATSNKNDCDGNNI